MSGRSVRDLIGVRLNFSYSNLEKVFYGNPGQPDDFI